MGRLDHAWPPTARSGSTRPPTRSPERHNRRRLCPDEDGERHARAFRQATASPGHCRAGRNLETVECQHRRQQRPLGRRRLRLSGSGSSGKTATLWYTGSSASTDRGFTLAANSTAKFNVDGQSHAERGHRRQRQSDKTGTGHAHARPGPTLMPEARRSAAAR